MIFTDVIAPGFFRNGDKRVRAVEREDEKSRFKIRQELRHACKLNFNQKFSRSKE